MALLSGAFSGCRGQLEPTGSGDASVDRQRRGLLADRFDARTPSWLRPDPRPRAPLKTDSGFVDQPHTDQGRSERAESEEPLR
jgi:hypothetical protein